jgi:hypothetical protein
MTVVVVVTGDVSVKPEMVGGVPDLLLLLHAARAIVTEATMTASDLFKGCQLSGPAPRAPEGA